MITAGFDVGSRFVKVVVAVDGKPAGWSRRAVGRDMGGIRGRVLKEACRMAGVAPKKIKRTVATGYGSGLVKGADLTVTDSVCAAAGAFHLDGEARAVVDAGGLFITITTIDDRGRPRDTITNDRCAAGSGKFLEMVSRAVEVPFEDISRNAEKSSTPYGISSNCAVFAESEVISQVNAGVPPPDVLAGVLGSIAGRTASLFEKLSAQDNILAIGGRACIGRYVADLSSRIGRQLIVPSFDPMMATALGAALVARTAPAKKRNFFR